MAKRTRATRARTPDPLPESGVAAGSLDDLIGQDDAVELLRRILDADRIPHAWLFGGPSGVGKRTLGLAFAAALLEPEEVGEATEARAMLASGSHPDLTLVTKELAAFSEDADVRKRKQRNIPIELLREFFDPAVARTATLPGRRAAKVCIIDQAHLLGRDGQNHLLKTLEEPPPRTVLILVADRPHDLLPTIHSRCQRLDLRPLPPEAMERWLDARGVGDDVERGTLLRLADGSPGDAELMRTTGVVGWPGELEPLLSRASNGDDDGALADACVLLASAWSEAWVKQRPAASKDAANRIAWGLVLRVAAEWCRARLRAGDADAESLDAIAACGGLLDRDVQPRFAFEVLAERLAVDALATPGR
ncbi:MAG: hypothetical protein AAFX79_05660 [Planctomycetota bacterium]